ncbi:cytochrome P460 family protein [Pelagibius sp. Alg239-R121]|uniref:cytochrome P460 family protein n=1 Tax=Pelagibius sp. Alg239-R121 TaxID=2993448 RepID=UPI0024A6FDB2|nr:cytochrome P460 family protein [Pelagibius sp. Alg239-R121]
MKKTIALLAVLGMPALAMAHPVDAADIVAGAKTAEVCAACHGGNGVSVSDDIPNLAGQKTKYLITQLRAFREGDRTNALMNAIAAQLDDTEIENVAAFFSGQLGAGADGESSDLLPELAADRVTFPDNYKATYTHYTTISFPNRKQVRFYYANEAALKAAGEGNAFPHGSFLMVEVYKAKLDANGEPVEGDDGHYVADKLAAYSTMEKQPGWGDSVPDILRNGDWSYAVFSADKTVKTGINEAKCLACYKPLVDEDYVFSLPQLQEKAAD